MHDNQTAKCFSFSCTEPCEPKRSAKKQKVIESTIFKIVTWSNQSGCEPLNLENEEVGCKATELTPILDYQLSPTQGDLRKS